MDKNAINQVAKTYQRLVESKNQQQINPNMGDIAQSVGQTYYDLGTNPVAQDRAYDALLWYLYGPDGPGPNITSIPSTSTPMSPKRVREIYGDNENPNVISNIALYFELYEELQGALSSLNDCNISGMCAPEYTNLLVITINQRVSQLRNLLHQIQFDARPDPVSP
jgi:hypothetical protein